MIWREATDLPVVSSAGNTLLCVAPALGDKKCGSPLPGAIGMFDMLRCSRRRPNKVGDCMKGNSYGLCA